MLSFIQQENEDLKVITHGHRQHTQCIPHNRLSLVTCKYCTKKCNLLCE